jgi:hypothetical protein
MADTRPERRFTRIDRLPPYVFNITAELKMAARRRGEDIIDFSMGNPDGATPPHIVEKLCTVAQRPDTHGLILLCVVDFSNSTPLTRTHCIWKIYIVRCYTPGLAKHIIIMD